MRLKSMFLLTGLLLLATTVYSSDLRLDVGVDNAVPWEWSQYNNYTGPETTPDFSSKLNQIVASDCGCSGCVIDGPYCVIPLGFSSVRPGEMNIGDVDVRYEYVRVLSNVTYGEAFKMSNGCEWHVQHPGGLSIARVPLTYSGLNTCYYTSSLSSLPKTEDALVDAVYRLVNQTLDSNQDGVLDISFNENTMSFHSQGMINVQSLWGPAVIKLIVWI